ncbi:MAG: signal peptidase II [Rhodospirillales bacterium]|jgi:signal peptidase II|nr:signal peptidase II [Rhodospirillales bacterium]
MPHLTYQGLGFAGLVLIIDQATKWWMMGLLMPPPRTIEVTSFFNLVVAWNRGISFGLFDTEGRMGVWILSGLALVICGVLFQWMRKAHRLVLVLALGAIIGGAVGNVIDRLRFGAVFDFLDVHLAGYHWPAFNGADSFISVGAVFLILDSLFARSDLESKIDES